MNTYIIIGCVVKPSALAKIAFDLSEDFKNMYLTYIENGSSEDAKFNTEKFEKLYKTDRLFHTEFECGLTFIDFEGLRVNYKYSWEGCVLGQCLLQISKSGNQLLEVPLETIIETRTKVEQAFAKLGINSK